MASPVASPSPGAGLLFAVLEAKGTANASTYNTVAIAGLDGQARAKTTFTPLATPQLGCIGALLPPQAYVAAGKVYFADGKGVVRSLAIDGTVTTVASFPLASTQQMLSFAVSPDGARLVGTIFTVPQNANPCTGSPIAAGYTFDAYSATSTTTNQLVYHDSWTTAPASVMALTGWDAAGPFGTYPTVWASQGGGPGSALGVRVRIDAATLRPGAPLADPSKCQVWTSIADGSFVCSSQPVTSGTTVTQSLSVRRPDGTQAWQFTVAGANVVSWPYLSSDAARVSVCCSDDTREWVIGRDGSRMALATGFFATGWLDATTAIGEYHPNPLTQPPLPLAYVALNAPDTAVSMGFSGQFIGTVRG